MKKIFRPAEKEEAVYFSDFSGKSFGEFDPPVELKISFNYGSKYDGTEVTVDLDDEEIKPILDILKQSISEDFKKSIKNRLDKLENDFEISVQMRDWDSCDRMSDTLLFWREFLGISGKFSWFI